MAPDSFPESVRAQRAQRFIHHKSQLHKLFILAARPTSEARPIKFSHWCPSACHLAHISPNTLSFRPFCSLYSSLCHLSLFLSSPLLHTPFTSSFLSLLMRSQLVLKMVTWSISNWKGKLVTYFENKPSLPCLANKHSCFWLIKCVVLPMEREAHYTNWTLSLSLCFVNGTISSQNVSWQMWWGPCGDGPLLTNWTSHHCGFLRTLILAGCLSSAAKMFFIALGIRSITSD